MKFLVSAALGVSLAAARRSELLPREEAEKLGVIWRGNSSKQSSHELLEATEMPSDFTWCNKDGKNYCTMSRNQHIPQYCAFLLDVAPFECFRAKVEAFMDALSGVSHWALDRHHHHVCH